MLAARTFLKWAVWAVIPMVVLLCIGWPVLEACIDFASGLAKGAGPMPRLDGLLLLKSAAVALLVAGLAMSIALPVAWGLRGRSGAWFGMLCMPLVMPSYLAYSGWGAIRDPSTAVGKWLLSGSPWYSVAAGYVLAVAGLVLWSWPLGAIVLLSRFRRMDPSVLDALRMEASGVGRWRAVVGAVRSSVGLGVAVVWLVMLGSAVPLHLAQLDTYAIHIWRKLDETPAAEHWRVWVSAWPSVLAAAVGAVVIMRKVLGDEAEDWASGRRGGRTWLAWAAWAISIPVPVIALCLGVKRWGVATTFLQVSHRPLEMSLIVSGSVAVIGMAVAAWVWWAIGVGGFSRRVARAAAAVLLFVGLWPGILTGLAVAHSWGGIAMVADSPAIVVIAHLMRYAFVGGLAGWWLSVTESRAQRDQQRMDVNASLAGWFEAAARPQVGAIIAAGLAMGLLSFQEIESTIAVQPPSSSGGGFAWLMLQWLHFSKMDELAIGVLLVVGTGCLAGLGIVSGVHIATRAVRSANETRVS